MRTRHEKDETCCTFMEIGDDKDKTCGNDEMDVNDNDNAKKKNSKPQKKKRKTNPENFPSWEVIATNVDQLEQEIVNMPLRINIEKVKSLNAFPIFLEDERCLQVLQNETTWFTGNMIDLLMNW